ncbi:MAG: DUF167 domain-containing protein [Gemmatimonadales bacterium]
MAIGYWLKAAGEAITEPVEQSAGGVLVRIRVQPRASCTEIVGLHGDRVRVRLSASPVDGQANEALIRFLSDRLDVPQSAVRLVSGHGSRSKTVLIRGAIVEQVAARLGL